jgi:hypothetical protein
MKEEYFCKKGTVILLDWSNGKRWGVILDAKKGWFEAFDTEEEARAYLNKIIKE